MSDVLRIGLVGATGLVGREVIKSCIGCHSVRLVGIARRETVLPEGARMEMFVADPDKWDEVLEAVKPDALICALGTTWKSASKDEEAFRAVDQHLVINTAKAAVAAGVERMVVVSSVNADANAKLFYSRVKGETEQQLSKVGLKRLDILQPGLLMGRRDNDPRLGEGIAKILSPVTDLMMHGKLRKFRSIAGKTVAEGALGLAARKAAGRFTHDNDMIRRAAREWEKRQDD
ncbi:MAG: NAD(P)H-binding protein [Erythrobacter sp.]